MRSKTTFCCWRIAWRRVPDAKSVLSVMSLALKRGQRVRLVAEGPDAPEAVEGLAEFLPV